eukprot:scaffold30638_cov58-Skeletonema_marinoi.AAC.1
MMSMSMSIDDAVDNNEGDDDDSHAGAAGILVFVHSSFKFCVVVGGDASKFSFSSCVNVISSKNSAAAAFNSSSSSSIVVATIFSSFE